MHVEKPLAHPANVEYLYDGSFEGFFCCVHESVYAHEIPAAIFVAGQEQPTLFTQKGIDTDDKKAQKVRASVPQKISAAALPLLETVFLSCLAEKEIVMLRFLLLGYRQGAKVMQMLGHPDVAPMLNAEKALGSETHLLKGFLRFADYGGILAATITPKNFVLPFLAEHFTMRYPNENFLIFDKTHKAALVHQEGQSRMIPLENIELPRESEEEKGYQQLWKQFYHTIAIEARYNPKCRMTHLPKRYWQNMTEMKELL